MSAEFEERPATLPAAFLGVIAIWSTTPLGIKWSTDAGFLFGVTARMLIATVLLVAVLASTGRRLPRHPAAIRTYVAASVGIFGAMTCVYWAAQWLPSGLMAVVFGLAPVLTALLSAAFLGERRGLPLKVLGGAIGVFGLWLIFREDAELGPGAGAGIAMTVFAAFLYALSVVWVKREHAGLGAIEQATGGMLVSAILFLLVYLFAGPGIPESVPTRALAAILYLAFFGSVVGFVWFYHLLRHMSPSSVALITLITPVSALIIGTLLNDETLPAPVLMGAAVIMSGLGIFYLADRRPVRPEEPVP